VTAIEITLYPMFKVGGEWSLQFLFGSIDMRKYGRQACTTIQVKSCGCGSYCSYAYCRTRC